MSASTDTHEKLVSYIRRVLNLREERKQITADIADLMRDAKDDGFDKARITEVCRRIERIADKGREQVLSEETIREIYIETWEQADLGAAFAAATKDSALLALIAKPAPPQAPRKIDKTVARLRADAADARKALGEE